MDRVCYYHKSYNKATRHIFKATSHIFLLCEECMLTPEILGSTYSSRVQEENFMMEVFTKMCTGLGKPTQDVKHRGASNSRKLAPPRARGGRGEGSYRNPVKCKAEATKRGPLTGCGPFMGAHSQHQYTAWEEGSWGRKIPTPPSTLCFGCWCCHWLNPTGSQKASDSSTESGSGTQDTKQD